MIVVDASCALSWFLPDERAGSAADEIRAIARDGATVPPLFLPEFVNGLRSAMRRKRIDRVRAGEILEHLARIPLRYASADFVRAEDLFGLALRRDLTAYDALYLALAKRLQAALLTTDDALSEAAAAEAVALYVPGLG